MRQRAKGGGTVETAPFGYINSRKRLEDGRKIKTVDVDPERGQWVPRIYEPYASGEWTVAMIREELNKRQVMTLARPNARARRSRTPTSTTS